MNVMRYALLVKDTKAQDKISLLQKIKNWVQIAGYVGLVVYLILLANQLSIVGAVIFLSTIVLELAYNVFFFLKISSLRKNQQLDSQDRIDQAVASLNQKYDVLARRRKILLFLAVAFVVIAIAALVGFTLSNPSDEALEVVAIVFAAAFVVVIFGASITDSVMQQKFVQKSLDELNVLDDFYCEARGITKKQGKRRRFNLFNVADNEKILSYLYPDEKLRKQARTIALYTLIPAILVGLVIGVFFPTAASNAEQNDFTLIWVLTGVFVLMIVGITVWVTLVQKKLKQQQMDVFESGREKYKYHIELQNATKAHEKLSNMIALIVLAVVAVTCTVLCLIFTDAETAVGIVVVGFFVLLVAIIGSLFVTYPRYRKKAKEIEIQIDEHLKQFEVVEVPFEEVAEEGNTNDSTTTSTPEENLDE